MALQMVQPTVYGFDAPQAYARIVMMVKDYVVEGTGIDVNVYYDADARQSGSAHIAAMRFVAQTGSLSLEATRAEAYGWLKTLPEFSGSVDV